jgi:hypothetical protein
MFSGLAALAFTTTLALTVADTVPVFNPDPSCREVAKSMNMNEAGIQQCIRDETSAKAELEKIWTTTPAAKRDGCAAETQVGGSPSYVDILECVKL